MRRRFTNLFILCHKKSAPASQEQANSGGWSTIQSNGSTSRAISGKGDGSYGYRVQACNTGGCGPWSATKAVSVVRLPAVPTGLGVTFVQPLTLYSVHFTAVSGATSYDMEETRDSLGSVPALYHLGTSTSQTFRKFSTNDTFHYRVRACNAKGCSAWSAPVDAEVYS